MSKKATRRKKPYRKPTLEHYGNLRQITTLS